MIILGLNAFHGDAAACLVVDGQLVASAAEERFRRIKHWAGMPSEAIRYCLHEGNTTLHEVDHIAINRNPSANMFKKALFALSKRPGLSSIRNRLHNASKVRDIKSDLADQFEIDKDRIRAPIHHVEHHRAHLASTFLVSPFDSAAVASVDGFGDFVSTMIGQGAGNKIQTLDQTTFPHSLGLLYLAMTQYLGFPRYGDEYKTMGLAACGKEEYLDTLRELIQLLPHGQFSLNLDFFLHHSEGVSMNWDGGEPTVGQAYSTKLVELLGEARSSHASLTPRFENIAASLQGLYEEAFFHILSNLAERTGERALCLAGGCALNSVANGRILERTPFERVYIPPAAADDGGAVGAAYSVSIETLAQKREFVLDRADWGPEFHTASIQQTIRDKDNDLSKNGCQLQRIEDSEKRCRWTAERLANGKIVGWFQGRMEWGARALGQRSILADPRRAEMKDVLNARIKQRETFRPFAPSILEESVSEYFEQTELSPFMTMTYQVRAEKQGVIPAPTHVNGSARLQTVGRLHQPLYWLLIKEFERLTGVPVLLNTSFNENEPIVCDPEQALECFLRTGMDVLVIGPFTVERVGHL